MSKTTNKFSPEVRERAVRMHQIANEMDVEDGVIWVYGVGDDAVRAFTDFGIEILVELIKIHKEHPTLRRPSEP